MNEKDFDEYIRQEEPHKREKGYAWQTAIGLQAVDGLKPSKYLYETACQHIEGEISIAEVKRLVDSYYESKDRRKPDPNRTEEADKVSARIAEILSEQTFSFSPVEYLNIHRRLFQNIFPHAGQIRDYNITKKEWVLRGATVLYASADTISAALEHDFSREKAFNYQGLSLTESIRHIAHFVSDLWQIHAFGEGNTRTTAVFTIKYLRKFGFDLNNEVFADHSWYFRNALVRANYTNLKQGITADSGFLERFFRTLLLNEPNELKNRTMLIGETPFQEEVSKCKICTLDCTLEEMAVLQFLKDHPKATQKDLAAHIGRSERTIKTLTVSLTQRGLLERKNGKRNGSWEVKGLDPDSE